MAYFARTLRYAANDGECGACFLALIELAKKKGGKAIEFLLYQYEVNYGESWLGIPPGSQAYMVRLQATSCEEAIWRFWPFGEGGAGKEFPGHRQNDKDGRWQKTTRWLYAAAVGGTYRQHDMGTWVRVATPSPWSRRRKKKPLRFGNISHILLARKALVHTLAEEKDSLEYELNNELVDWDSDNDCACLPRTSGRLSAYRDAEDRLAALEDELTGAELRVRATEQEIRSALRQLFPEPLGRKPRRDLRPKRGSRMVW